MSPGDLDPALRKEIAAIDTYRKAIAEAERGPPLGERLASLTRMLHEHEQAADRLKSAIEELNRQASSADPQTRAAGGRTAPAVAAAAVLRALESTEQAGLAEYRRIHDDRAAPDGLRHLAGELIARHEARIRELDALMSAG